MRRQQNSVRTQATTARTLATAAETIGTSQTSTAERRPCNSRDASNLRQRLTNRVKFVHFESDRFQSIP